MGSTLLNASRQNVAEKRRVAKDYLLKGAAMKVEIEVNEKLERKLRSVFPSMAAIQELRDIVLAAIEKQKEGK